VHPVDPYYTDTLRGTVHKTLSLVQRSSFLVATDIIICNILSNFLRYCKEISIKGVRNRLVIMNIISIIIKPVKTSLVSFCPIYLFITFQAVLVMLLVV
jgi:hypothetical protein